MKSKSKKRRASFFAVLMLTFFLMGCPTTTTLILIPLFSNNWSDANDEEHFIFLQNESFDESSGTLRGEERHESDSNRNENEIVGTFDQEQIEFTIQRNDGNNPIVYTGTMFPLSDDDPTIVRMELTSSEGSLILVPPLDGE
ncbi:hypothetical protein [Flagellimonas onchidii]|uniref:hypothetical protein n=1 Tax=Flagellimonas onchidii TaxID=2562684 RepID=UPI0010A66E15|nr:hypothetical protein [Allomuricauda onchidii]